MVDGTFDRILDGWLIEHSMVRFNGAFDGVFNKTFDRAVDDGTFDVTRLILPSATPHQYGRAYTSTAP